MIRLPRIMLAAPSSGSGKTTLTCGVLQSFVKRGLSPASFKCGPDYIDPMFHTKVIGAKSRNLDTFFTDKEVTRYLFARNAVNAGVSVLEGVMGIFDGLGGTSASASSYDLASVTDTPVILVVNARGMSLSVIPMIQGYLDYQKQLGKEVIRGVILNQMTKMTYLLLKEKIEQQTGTRLLGYVPRLEGCAIESRHLGLVTPDEITDLRQTLNRLSEELEKCLDLDGILEIAGSAPDYEERELQPPEKAAWRNILGKLPDNVPKIGVAMDEAFCFYYQDNLELLQRMGAELVKFSPLHDEGLPGQLDGMLLGGGYPELYAEQLEENVSMKEQICEALLKGMPYLAECGGFMYLHEEMEDMEGCAHEMCGVIPGRSFRTPKLSRFGYIDLSVKEGSKAQLLKAGQTIRGHEFHYFDSTDSGTDYHAQKPAGKRNWDCIHGNGHSAAGYPHLYYWSNPEFASEFVRCAAEYAARRYV